MTDTVQLDCTRTSHNRFMSGKQDDDVSLDGISLSVPAASTNTITAITAAAEEEDDDNDVEMEELSNKDQKQHEDPSMPLREEHDSRRNPLTSDASQPFGNISGVRGSEQFDSIRLGELLYQHECDKFNAKEIWRRRSSSSRLTVPSEYIPVDEEEAKSIKASARTSLSVLARAYNSEPLTLCANKKISRSCNSNISKEVVSPENSVNHRHVDTNLSFVTDAASTFSGYSVADFSVLYNEDDEHDEATGENSKHLHSNLEKNINIGGVRLGDTEHALLKRSYFEMVASLSTIDLSNSLSSCETGEKSTNRLGNHEEKSESLQRERISEEKNFLDTLGHITGSKKLLESEEEEKICMPSLECHLKYLDNLNTPNESNRSTLKPNTDEEKNSRNRPPIMALYRSSLFLLSLVTSTIVLRLSIHLPMMNDSSSKNWINMAIHDKCSQVSKSFRCITQALKGEICNAVNLHTDEFPIFMKTNVNSILNNSNNSSDVCEDDFAYWRRNFDCIEESIYTTDALFSKELSIEVEQLAVSSQRGTSNAFRPFWTPRSNQHINIFTPRKRNSISEILSIKNKKTEDTIQKKAVFWNLLEDESDEERPLADFASEIFQLLFSKIRRKRKSNNSDIAIYP